MSTPFPGQDIFLAQRPIDPEPLKIRAGDTTQWSRSYDGYPSSAGYTLSYVLVSKTALYTFNATTSTGSVDGFDVTVPAATTAGWAPGGYRWQAYISDTAGERWTVGEGKVEVLPNLQTATSGLDDREQDEIILDNIRLMISGKAGADVQRYMISGRELQRYTWKELLEAQSVYERRVRGIRLRRGEKVPSRRIGARFGGVYGR